MARRLGMSRSELFRRAVEEYMESHRHDAVREALDAVYAEEPDALDSTLADLQFASIPGRRLVARHGQSGRASIS